DMNARAAEALALESKLRRAIERQEFVLHYQPKIKFSDGRICGLEALIRWQDPEQGLIPPIRFISVLEEAGLIGVVGQWALGQAMADCRRWRDAGLGALRVAVNVSPLQLHQPDFSAQITNAVTVDGGGVLELEITESVIMDNVEYNVAVLKEIRTLGVTIAIDDFGTGYSSLAYIAQLPVTSLKIDRAFVTGMTQGPEGWTMVSSIIALAHALQLKVVAEGVETEEQAQMLRLLSCDEAQGFLFSRPVAASEIEAMLRSGDSLPVAVSGGRLL
ncbi:MAG: EAL domain-containing protein, partial [Arenimonas sp.]